MSRSIRAEIATTRASTEVNIALSKTLEKVMNFQLNRFFEDTHLFSNSRDAYRQHRS